MSLAGSRCLVTGATGFIGWHLVKRLVEESAEVFCIVEPGVDSAELESAGGVSDILVADLTEARAIRRAVEAANPSLVFHLAAVGVTEPAIDPVGAVRVNVEGSVNLLLALDGSFDLFINTGTCHEYGEGRLPLRESLPTAPTTVYAASKVAAWHFCNLFFRTRGWPIVTLRLFSVYGPRQPSRTLVPSVILSGLRKEELPMTDGDRVRDFVLVDDIVGGYLLAAGNRASVGQTFNLCSGRGISLRRLVSLIEGLIGPAPVKFGSLPSRAGEAPEIVGDNSLARKVLKWVPKVSLEEGLKLTVEWYKGCLEGHRSGRGCRKA